MRGLAVLMLSVLFVLLWSSGWIVSKFATQEVTVVILLLIRYLIVFALLLILLVFTRTLRKLKRINVRAHLLVGALSHALYLLAGIGAFELGVSASFVAFVTSLQPMITAAMSRSITHEAVSARQWQGLAIGLCAVLLLISDSYGNGLQGLALCLPLVSVLALSTGTLIHRRIELDNQVLGRRPDPLIPVLFLHYSGALLVILPLSLAHDPLSISLGTTEWIVILWLAVVVSLGAYAILLLLLRHMSAMQTSSLAYLVPPATMLQAWVFFGESISLMETASLGIIAVAVYLVIQGDRQTRLGPYKNIKPGSTVEV